MITATDARTTAKQQRQPKIQSSNDTLTASVSTKLHKINLLPFCPKNYFKVIGIHYFTTTLRTSSR